MGMLDNNTKFATAQAVTALGDTASTNVYDTGNAIGGDIALTENTWLQATVNTLATSAGAATLQAVLQDSADNATFADVQSGPVVPVASLVVGAVLFQGTPPVPLRRYVRIAWRVGTAALTAGKFDAYISAGLQRNVARASGFSVQ